VTGQLALDTIWPCDQCEGSCVETDPETLLERPCRQCRGEGFQDYPPVTGDDPFDGIQTQ
jgi:hypothetical protein